VGTGLKGKGVRVRVDRSDRQGGGQKAEKEKKDAKRRERSTRGGGENQSISISGGERLISQQNREVKKEKR